MRRVLKFIDGKKDRWIEDAKQKEFNKSQSIALKEHKKRELELLKKTPQYRLQQIEKSIKQWESKKRRAENSLKRLYRRKKFWEKKLL